MTLLEAEMPWWWIASAVAAVAISALVPIAMLHSFRDKKREQREAMMAADKKREDAPPPMKGWVSGGECIDEPDNIQLEPWIPKLEIKEWSQACQLPGCPWSFDTCEDLPEVLERIWRQPLCTELQTAFDALKPRVKNVQVARVSLAMPKATHYAIIYTLITGAELFGGAPLEHAVGLDLGEDPDKDGLDLASADGLRRRRGMPSPTRQARPEGLEIPLPGLLPFYRIHDGFGILLTNKHLPVLLGCPGDSVDGSCFYVQPARGLEPYGNRDGIVRFARVDRLCQACADSFRENPTVIYVEKFGQQTEDDETLLSFISDTVSSVAGQRVVPPSYMGGPKMSACYGNDN